MGSSEKELWLENIENAASSLAADYGTAVVDSVFARYNAHDFSDLASCYYTDVFYDL